MFDRRKEVVELSMKGETTVLSSFCKREYVSGPSVYADVFARKRTKRLERKAGISYEEAHVYFTVD